MNDEPGNDSSLLFNLTSEKPKFKKKVLKKISQDEPNSSATPPLKREEVKKQWNKVSPSKQPPPITPKIGNDSVRQSSLFSKGDSFVPTVVVNKKAPPSEPLFSTKVFDDLELHPHLISCLKSRLEIERVTKVQEQTIPVLLEGRDALVKSCTGSGKTLSYAIPIVQKLREIEPKIKRSDGVFALIVVPSRELALQCFEVFSTLSKSSTWIVPGYLIGGEKKKAEKARLRKGINILISTPGRLLDHLDNTANLSLEKIIWLIIDEADMLFEQGFEESIAKIVSKCNKIRQSVLLSATLSKGVESLAGMSLSSPVSIGHLEEEGTPAEKGRRDDSSKGFVIPKHLKQFVVVVPPKLRLVTLSGFIADNCLKYGFKGIIFMCSQNSVDFHHSLLSSVLAAILMNKNHKLKFFKLHGNMKQEERTEIFSAFRGVKEGLLLSTDVAARGLDLPAVDWIVQYSAPPSVEMYIHRAGRTARIGKKGSSLLFLLPAENNFCHLLAAQAISFDQISYNQFLQPLLLLSDVLLPRSKCGAEDCATALQNQYESEVYKEKELHESAKEAFASYIQSYASYPKNIRHVLPFKSVHLGHIAKSFCIREAPSTLGISMLYRQKPQQRNTESRVFQKNAGMKRKYQSSAFEYESGSNAAHKGFRSEGMRPKFSTAKISEFDSGLDSVKLDYEKKPKKRKKH